MEKKLKVSESKDEMVLEIAKELENMQLSEFAKEYTVGENGLNPTFKIHKNNGERFMDNIWVKVVRGEYQVYGPYGYQYARSAEHAASLAKRFYDCELIEVALYTPTICATAFMIYPYEKGDTFEQTVAKLNSVVGAFLSEAGPHINSGRIVNLPGYNFVASTFTSMTMTMLRFGRIEHARVDDKAKIYVRTGIMGENPDHVFILQ
ncbi:MAG: hypothetical protein FWD89_01050 [Firmicutes bacterium]|nr:hypothetical protein [Bacillota bacterium]MCL2770880.1 hypothetical protein [Bacillota bacterium]